MVPGRQSASRAVWADTPDLPRSRKGSYPFGSHANQIQHTSNSPPRSPLGANFLTTVLSQQSVLPLRDILHPFRPPAARPKKKTWL